MVKFSLAFLLLALMGIASNAQNWIDTPNENNGNGPEENNGNNENNGNGGGNPNRCPTDARERWPWRLLTCDEQDDFLTALQRLKDSGVYDDFVWTHIWMEDEAHGVAAFLPWHRWYIYQFESALRSVADDPCITLPYWD